MEQPFLVIAGQGNGRKPVPQCKKCRREDRLAALLAGAWRALQSGGRTVYSAQTSRPATFFRDRLAVPLRRIGKMGGGDLMTNLGGLLPFILIFVIMYFLILRPQQKRAKQHQEMVKNLRRGDNVITSGGLVGKVTKVVDDDQVEIEIADGVRVRQVKSMIADVRVKGEPVKDEAAS
jgi:preprotein translocase subunit YajC